MGPDCQPAECAAHSCESALNSAQFCEESGNLVAAGDGCSASAPSTPVFRFALCSCTDFVTSSPFEVDGPAAPAIAIDGELRVADGVRLAGSVRVGEELRTGSTSMPPDIGGRLEEHADPSCACGGDALFDFSAALSQRRTDNDNAARDPRELDGFSGARDLDLACGRYYFTRIAGTGALRMRIHGRVALFVAGNIELDDAWNVQLDAGAQLTLIIAGNVRVGGRLELNPGGDASNAQLLVGGAGTIDLNAETSVHATLYAPRSELVTRARFELSGALLLRRVAPGAEFIVHYAASAGDPAANGCQAN